MLSAPFTLQEILRRLVLRLVLMVESALSARVAGLRERLAGMRAGHRHRARMERELARAERYRALLEDPEFWADPRAAGALAQVARVRVDAGRRAWVRRVRWPVPLRRMGVFGLVERLDDWEGRCRGGVGVSAALRVDSAAAPPHPGSLPPQGGEGGCVWVAGHGGRGLPAAIWRVRGAACPPPARPGNPGGGTWPWRLVRRGVVLDDAGEKETAR